MKELHEKLKYKFIDKESELYHSAIELRYREFYETSNRSRESIFDEFEDKSLRVVAYMDHNDMDHKVVGHARLFVEGNVGEITQVVVDHEYRGYKIGAGIIKQLFIKAEELNLKSVGLDARIPAVEFYKKFDFKIVGEEYISPKSGMPIIRMEKSFRD
ncbi:GNAT family N-acetyltransferase [Clostridium sp. SM-530-WT-3G]|uniref:GNAT family N-acetyltransferase n=1 Tax=Clostridium sp. SM-530-WT-3G TaxID=2725303 RepID=UPI00145C6487|nr:GNAT family N-acetyltransferase [Clostridium sp. SM-530-WT-3G]NME83455.1 GNAT family N-acetyltransferase [Clostridium sp. SM-530-WT-3G]